jgi:glucokinase
MERRARSLAKRGHKTSLFSIMRERGRQRLSSSVYAMALERGDRMTHELIEDATWALGIGLASAQNLLDLEAIIVGGGLGDRLGQPFVDRVVAQMRPHLFVSANPPAVVRTELGDLAGAVGAAVLVGG